MTKSIVKGYTPVASTKQITLDDLGYGTDWAVKGGVSNHGVFTNITTPVSFPETLRIAVKDVSNVYADTGIDPGLWAPTARGRSLVVSLRDTWREIDSEDATYEVALPMKAHLVLEVPNQNGTISASDINAFVTRLISALFTGGVSADSRITDILRGVIKPSGM